MHLFPLPQGRRLEEICAGLTLRAEQPVFQLCAGSTGTKMLRKQAVPASKSCGIYCQAWSLKSGSVLAQCKLC